MSTYLSTGATDMGGLNTDLQGLGTLTTSAGQDWYTAHNIFNPNSPQFATVKGAGGNVFGATVTQNQLQPSVFSGIFGTTGFGGLSPLLMLIILFIVILVGYFILKRI